MTSAVAPLAPILGDLGVPVFKEAKDTVDGMGKGLLAWDDWGKNPAEAAGKVVFNVGTMFIPGVDIVKGVSVLSKVEIVANAISKVDRIAGDLKGLFPGGKLPHVDVPDGAIHAPEVHLPDAPTKLVDVPHLPDQHVPDGLTPHLPFDASNVNVHLPEEHVPGATTPSADALDGHAPGEAAPNGHQPGKSSPHTTTDEVATPRTPVEHAGGVRDAREHADASQTTHERHQSHAEGELRSSDGVQHLGGGVTSGEHWMPHADGHVPGEHMQESVGGGDGSSVGGAHGGNPGRLYTLADGSSYTTRWAPEQVRGMLSAYDELSGHVTAAGRTMDDLMQLVHRPTSSLSPADVTFLHDIRLKVHLDESTVFQKVIPPGEDLARMDGSYHYPVDTLGGFITRLQDVTHFKNSQDVFAGLRLDYSGSEFHSLVDGPIQMIRYKSGTANEIPFDKSLLGQSSRFDSPPPFTGNGFTSSGLPHPDGHLVPEFHAPPGVVKPGAEMWEVTTSGTYRLLAVLDVDLRWLKVRG